MFLVIKFKRIIIVLTILLFISSILSYTVINKYSEAVDTNQQYIKWVDFNVTSAAMDKAYNLDVKSHTTEGSIKYNWIEILSYLGNKYGGDFKKYNEKDIDNLIQRLNSGETIESITENMKYYNYYLEAYTAVLGGFVGEYRIQVEKDGNIEWENKYGLKAFLPIAKGYSYNEFDDFGVSRDYGYKRKHQGHDFMGNIGTPICAVESGIIEEIGWNQYGGWRIGIRSYDKKRYYYYAHLRKDYPYAEHLEKGMEVKAGDVIGYLGRTGYSANENVNNITQNHLHFGMQLIFDESQKDGTNQIWINCYQISKFLQKNRSKVQKVEGTKEYKRVYDFEDLTIREE